MQAKKEQEVKPSFKTKISVAKGNIDTFQFAQQVIRPKAKAEGLFYFLRHYLDKGEMAVDSRILQRGFKGYRKHLDDFIQMGLLEKTGNHQQGVSCSKYRLTPMGYSIPLPDGYKPPFIDVRSAEAKRQEENIKRFFGNKISARTKESYGRCYSQIVNMKREERPKYLRGLISYDLRSGDFQLQIREYGTEADKKLFGWFCLDDGGLYQAYLKWNPEDKRTKRAIQKEACLILNEKKEYATFTPFAKWFRGIFSKSLFAKIRNNVHRQHSISTRLENEVFGKKLGRFGVRINDAIIIKKRDEYEVERILANLGLFTSKEEYDLGLDIGTFPLPSWSYVIPTRTMNRQDPKKIETALQKWQMGLDPPLK